MFVRPYCGKFDCRVCLGVRGALPPLLPPDVPGCGHLLPLHCPGAVARGAGSLLRWYSTVDWLLDWSLTCHYLGTPPSPSPSCGPPLLPPDIPGRVGLLRTTYCRGQRLLHQALPQVGTRVDNIKKCIQFVVCSWRASESSKLIYFTKQNSTKFYPLVLPSTKSGVFIIGP